MAEARSKLLWDHTAAITCHIAAGYSGKKKPKYSDHHPHMKSGGDDNNRKRGRRRAKRKSR